MAKSKHKITKQGTHRQRVYRFKQSIIAQRKQLAESERQASQPKPPQTYEVTEIHEE